jgi:hypothetical protein
VVSEAAAMAVLEVPCSGCRRKTKVVCIYCRDGLVAGAPCRQFSCTAIRSFDWWTSALLTASHPQLRKVGAVPAGEGGPPAGVYLNHCIHCGAAQRNEYVGEYWHDRGNWGRVEGSGLIRLFVIPGTVRLSADVSLIY